jgi:GNAT superfamily N-acetyltransferase
MADTMAAVFSIRPIEKPDFEQWAPLWAGYNLFYDRARLDEEITRTTFARFLDDDAPVHAAVAQQGDRLVGLVHYLFHPSTTSIGPVCYLQDLFTDDSCRRKGVGRALIEFVYERAAQAGAGRVYWLTHETNTAAMRLYDQLAELTGFRRYVKAIG